MARAGEQQHAPDGAVGIPHLAGDLPESSQLIIGEDARSRFALANDPLGLKAINRGRLDPIGLLIDSPTKKAADASEEIMGLVGSAARDRLDNLDDVARGDLGDRAPAQDRGELTLEIACNLCTLAFSGEFIASEIFYYRGERGGMLALFGKALALDLDCGINAARDQLEPFACRVASLFK